MYKPISCRPFILLLIRSGLLLFMLLVPEKGKSQPQDSTVRVAAGKQYLRSGFHQFLWGKHYRKVWAEPVEVPLFWMGDFKGGAEPVKQGGSYQTKNLRLQDSLGREYVLRSIDKDPTKALPKMLQKTFVAGLMQDQTSVIHPYGAFIVPVLAQAAGVHHTNPRLVYIPDDSTLGKFREEFANTLVLLEERPDGEGWKNLESFGKPANILSSRKAMDRLLKYPLHQVEAEQYLRSRLFDMWLSDWSRREDQWRWGVEENGKVLYMPIPRDRDHAFFKFNDGLITSIFSLFKPNYQSFDHTIVGQNVKGLISASMQMDSYLLAYLPKESFTNMALELQRSLTDEVIEQAINKWPEQIKNLSAHEFRTKLKARRNDLPKAAEAFYKEINKQVKLAGSDEDDIFHVHFNPDGSLLVQHWMREKGRENQVLDQKIFYPAETKEIALYGLSGDDVLQLSGSGKSKIKLSWYGGEGKDETKKDKAWKVQGKKVVVFNEEDGNDHKKSKMVKVKDYSPKANEFSADGWLLRHRLH